MFDYYFFKTSKEFSYLFNFYSLPIKMRWLTLLNVNFLIYMKTKASGQCNLGP